MKVVYLTNDSWYVIRRMVDVLYYLDIINKYELRNAMNAIFLRREDQKKFNQMAMNL